VPIDEPLLAQAAAPPPADPAPRRNADLDFSPAIASTVVGALFFPAISATVGDILLRTLPAKWLGRKSILGEKWGRTIVGGCLFVVLKDAVVLYCKWKKARDFGKKKIMDYKGPRGAARAS
jgi:hypothetical protein